MSFPGTKKYIFATNLFYWMIVIGSFAFLVLTARLNFVKEPNTSPANACINNLRQIDAAAYEFALEHHLTNGDRINFPSDLTPYIKLDRKGNIPSCPQGGVYHISKVGETPTCSLSTTVVPAHVLP
jgi:hypothetical protein